MAGIIGKKLGMTQIFEETGAVVPVTVIEAGPCPVVQARTSGDAAGHRRLQLGFGVQKANRTTRAVSGHAAKAGLDTAPRILREFSFAEEDAKDVGDSVTVELFESGARIKVAGTTKGRGFQGVVKRHGFSGGPETHGSTFHRVPGSLGAGTNPSRVIKGKRLPGQMGNVRRTVSNLRIAKIDAERGLLFVRGAVPGSTGGYVFITKQSR